MLFFRWNSVRLSVIIQGMTVTVDRWTLSFVWRNAASLGSEARSISRFVSASNDGHISHVYAVINFPGI